MQAIALLLIIRLRRRRREREEQALLSERSRLTRETLLSTKALLSRKARLSRRASDATMAERKSKRQRFSLGGPAVDASFEDYLTGEGKRVSSDEEEFDQENVDPEVVAEDEYDEEVEDDPDMDSPGLEARENGYTMLDGPAEDFFGYEGPESEGEDDYEDEPESRPEPEPEPEPVRPAPAPTTGLTKDKQQLINKIHIHQNNMRNSTAKDTYYLLHASLILPEGLVAVTRLLRVPAILLFQQLSEALYATFDWGGYYSKYTLQQHPQAPSFNTISKNLGDKRKEIATIRNLDPKLRREPPLAADSSTVLDTRKVRLMDLWNQTQIPEVKALKLYFTYNCDGVEGNSAYAAITYMGIADQDLQATDLNIDVDEEQQIWCVGGSGACIPEYLPEDQVGKWEEETNKYEWDMEFHNAELSHVKVREASFYYT
jgi:hypothetical protein